MYKYVQCTHIFICMYRACEYYMPNSFVNSVYWNSLLLFDKGARPKIVNNSYLCFLIFWISLWVMGIHKYIHPKVINTEYDYYTISINSCPKSRNLHTANQGSFGQDFLDIQQIQYIQPCKLGRKCGYTQNISFPIHTTHTHSTQIQYSQCRGVQYKRYYVYIIKCQLETDLNEMYFDLSIYLSIYLSTYLSIYLSIDLYQEGGYMSPGSQISPHGLLSSRPGSPESQ